MKTTTRSLCVVVLSLLCLAPALRAANSPTNTAPLTEVSASVESGEYRQPPKLFFFCDVTAARTASSSACPMLRPLPFSAANKSRSSTTPYASASPSMANPW